MLYLLLIFLFFPFFNSSIIDYSSTKIITINQTNSFFGYSILLQSGRSPVAIIGAPRSKNLNKTTGSVHFCEFNNKSHCEEYYRMSERNAMLGKYVDNKNGDFLGSVLDGDNIVGGGFYTCAPRFVTSKRFSEDYYLNGRCYLIRHSWYIRDQSPETILPLQYYAQVSFEKSVAYYDAAFAESGFDILYWKEQNELLVGAPGKAFWNGAFFSIKNTGLSHTSNLISPQPLLNNNYYTLLGYAVSWGRFLKNSQKVWYVSGAPRGENLKGMVVFFDNFGHNVTTKLVGEEFGSYFGSSLLVVHRKTGDDILVGAPMYSGETFDEGCVYYYKNSNFVKGIFDAPLKLSNKKIASRFGTVIADAGDMDLDSFPDCAISAPYENGGIGSVYIYFGTETGFSNNKFLKIEPSQFSVLYPKTVKGFGLGISRGVDVNFDNHKDIAIGAYRTGQVFVFKTNQLVDVEAKLTSNLRMLYTSTTNFSIAFCLKFLYRNGANLTQLFNTTLFLVDDRIRNEKHMSQMIVATPNQWICKNHLVLVKTNHFNLEPLVVRFWYNHTLDEFREEVLKLPVLYACGIDNICQTNLKVEAKLVDISEIVFGLNTDLKINVTVDNFGESAYQTRIYIDLPQDISLNNLRDCELSNGSYTCLVADELKSQTQKLFSLDLDNLEPNRTNITINFSVRSLGQEFDAIDNNFDLVIPILMRNSPDIFSQSVPDKLFLDKTKNVIFIHNFVLGNQGPSPFDLDLTILVPVFDCKDKILEIESVEGSVNGMVTECRYSTPKYEIFGQKNKNLSCDATRCTEINCDVGNLHKFKNAVFTVKLRVNIQVLMKFIETQDQLMISSTAFFNNGTREFRTTASTLIYIIGKETKIPFWIYIVSVFSGILLLVLIIYSLYKCNFFTRTYKDRLENEQFEGNAFVEESSSEEM